MFKRGDTVWGKLRAYPWWPAMVINAQDCGRDNVGENKCWLFWFGDHQIGQVEYCQVLDFKLYFDEKYRPKIGKRFNRSVQEVLIILATRYNIEYSDPSSLFEWAKNGFLTKLRIRSNEPNALDLPNIVMKALKKGSKRNHESSSEEDSDNEIDKLLDDVRRNRKALEDICLVCSKLKNSVIMLHPLFIGGVCQNCKKNIFKIMKCTKGQMNDICVLCGEGGKLVYCCISECKSSFCETCIDYMTPKNTFSKILKDDNWKCFLCDPKNDVDCLIKRREVHLSMKVNPPLVPNEKLPIRVIGLSDAACPVLKKKRIAVELYRTESTKCLEPSTSKQDLYNDFTREEILEIRPDFIYGSFFVSSTAVVDRKKSVESFLASFYKFLFRLNNAKDTKPTVFFMFMSDDEILDAEIKSRVKRFTQVDPLIIDLPAKKVCLWTNVPDIKGIKDGKYTMKTRGSIEQGVLNKFLEPLMKYFKREM